MRLNSKIVSVIISLAFVGGMFTAVYAGPVIATITLDGNVHTTGDSTVDGDLTVGGVSFAALEARIASLETTAIPSLQASVLDIETNKVPMITANEVMITTQGNTLTTHGTTLTTHGNTLTLHNDMIEANAAAIEAGGGGPNPCNPNGDSQITAQEIKDLLDSIGISKSINSVTTRILLAENAVGSPQQNGILDTLQEVSRFNGDWFTPLSGIVCTYP